MKQADSEKWGKAWNLQRRRRNHGAKTSIRSEKETKRREKEGKKKEEAMKYHSIQGVHAETEDGEAEVGRTKGNVSSLACPFLTVNIYTIQAFR